jgi:hypothetical protein
LDFQLAKRFSGTDFLGCRTSHDSEIKRENPSGNRAINREGTGKEQQEVLSGDFLRVMLVSLVV